MKAEMSVRLVVDMSATELQALRDSLLIAWQQRGESAERPGSLKKLYEALIAAEPSNG